MQPIAFWKTRSFWALVVTIGAPFLPIDLGEAEQAQLVDLIMSILPVVAGAVMYAERLNPSRRVALKG